MAPYIRRSPPTSLSGVLRLCGALLLIFSSIAPGALRAAEQSLDARSLEPIVRTTKGLLKGIEYHYGIQYDCALWDPILGY